MMLVYAPDGPLCCERGVMAASQLCLEMAVGGLQVGIDEAKVSVRISVNVSRLVTMIGWCLLLVAPSSATSSDHASISRLVRF